MFLLKFSANREDALQLHDLTRQDVLYLLFTHLQEIHQILPTLHHSLRLSSHFQLVAHSPQFTHVTRFHIPVPIVAISQRIRPGHILVLATGAEHFDHHSKFIHYPLYFHCFCFLFIKMFGNAIVPVFTRKGIGNKKTLQQKVARVKKG